MGSSYDTAKKKDKTPIWDGAKKQAEKLRESNSNNNENLASNAKGSSQTLWCNFIEINGNQNHGLKHENKIGDMVKIPLRKKSH